MTLATSTASKNKHSASASFAGYLFQIERLIFWLSISDVELVALETEDDVVAKLKGISPIKILEQAKHSVTSRVPYSDTSVDLWKTLSIWAKSALASTSDLDTITFSLITNKRLPSNRLIKKLVESKNNAEIFDLCFEKLISIASTCRGKVKPFAQEVLKCDRDVLKAMVRRIEIISEETATDIKNLKQHVRSNLGISDRLPFDYMYQEILGLVVHQIIQTWKKNEPFQFSREVVLRRVNESIALYQKKSFIERTIDLLPLSRVEVERNKGKLFVEQLKAIHCDDEEIIKAINEFMRSDIEKSRYAEEGEVLEYHFEQYYMDLKEHWQSVG